MKRATAKELMQYRQFLRHDTTPWVNLLCQGFLASVKLRGIASPGKVELFRGGESKARTKLVVMGKARFYVIL